MTDQDETQLNPDAEPSGSGCAECLSGGGWWFHLRRCAGCGHIGCCDSSPAQHASGHARDAGHQLIRSFEPGEDWFYSYETDELLDGPVLAGPQHHPPEQPSPGPAGQVPSDWVRHLH